MSNQYPPYGQPQGRQPGPPAGPSYGPPPGPPQGWGPLPGPQGQGPGGPRKNTGVVVAAIVAAAVVVLAAVGVGIYFAVDQMGGDDPSPTPAASSSDPGSSDDEGASGGEAMSAEAGEALRAGLEDDGWTCYDSLDEPVELDRCFRLPDADDMGDYPRSSRVSIVHGDDSDVDQVWVRSYTADPGEELDEVAGLVGDTMLDGHGDELRADRSSTDGEIGSVRISGEADDWFQITTDDADYTPVEGPKGADVASLRSAFEDDGGSCDTSDDKVMSCTLRRDGYDVRGTASVDGGSAGQLSVSVMSSFDADEASLADAAGIAADVIQRAGLTDDDGVAFLTGDPAEGMEGDFAHVNLAVISARDSSDYVTIYVSVDTIRI